MARWFFRVGGAAGTIAQTISAYDMTVSDASYGHTEHYVSNVPALALTALAGEEDRRGVLSAGFQLHVAKPVDTVRLTRAVLELAHGASSPPGSIPARGSGG